MTVSRCEDDVGMEREVFKEGDERAFSLLEAGSDRAGNLGARRSGC
jgi:hypothetical protein